MLSHAEIKAIMPHRYPMLLVDAVSESESGAVLAVKNITGNEPCYSVLSDRADRRDHAYPASLIIESFSQAAGVFYTRLKREEGFVVEGIMLFGSIVGFRFLADAYPGDTLRHHVRLERGFSDAAMFSGEVRVGDRKIAEADSIMIAMRPPEILHNQGDPGQGGAHG